MPIYTERAAGTYRAKYLGCAEKTLTDKETNEEVVRWLWRFQELTDPTTAGELGKFTGTSMQSANSNAYRMATGILGHKPQPGDDTEAHVGEVYDLFYGPNQAGNLTIVGVVPVKDQAAAALPTPPKVTHEIDNGQGMTVTHEAEAKVPDELPF